MSLGKGPRTDRPRTNQYPAEVTRKESLLQEPHVAPLTEYVEGLRREHGRDAVPWFDPTDAGIGARILVLRAAAGRRPLLRDERGARFVSADDDEDTAEQLWSGLEAAGIDRRREYAAWNVVPWETQRGKATRRDVEAARPALERLLALLPELRVVLLVGDSAQAAWETAGLKTHAVVLHTNGAARELRDALRRAKALTEATPQQQAVEHRAATVRVNPVARLEGHIAVPGDKSISHRALLIGALCEGETRVTHFGRGGDTESTLAAVRALGVQVDEEDVDTLVVHGVGLRGLRAPETPLDCGNAGTLARLISGVLAFQPGTFELVGDESLSRRPMGRVVEPLTQMGARLEATEGHLPLRIEGAELHGITYELPVASAQVKSAILLAGLGATTATSVVEPVPTRDHTELMLQAAGVNVRRRGSTITLEPPRQPLRLAEVDVPGDISSAAPFLVAAALLTGSNLTVHDLHLNPLRTGLLDVLERMGIDVGISGKRRVAGELVGDVEIVARPLKATNIEADEVPRLVDELPLVALLAAFAHGSTTIRGAEELRAKESDRIDVVVTGLRALGVRIEARRDGFVVKGTPSRPRGGRIDAHGDHRIAMLGAVAGAVSREGVDVRGAESVAVSFPGFFELLDSVAQR